MSQVPSNDVTVNGGGTIAEGSYGSVTINGAGTVTGDLVCTTLKINGAATFNGDVKAATIGVNGSGTFNRAVQVSDLNVNGDATVRGGLGVTSLAVRGNLKVEGGIAAVDIDIRGLLKTLGDITCETLHGEGSLTAVNVNARSVDMGVYGTSRLGHLEAERVTIRVPNSFAEVIRMFTRKEFNAESIRAREAFLEDTVANVVSAGNVTVGQNSRIGLVQYSGAYATQGNAAVTEARQVTAG